MFTKLVPTILLVLSTIVVTAKARWPAAAPSQGAAKPGLMAPPQPTLAAADDFRINLDGVTANAYDLEPLVSGDAAHTRLMVAGIVGRQREP